MSGLNAYVQALVDNGMATATWYGADGKPIEPKYNGPMEPEHPCRIMHTRHCPAVYGDVCGDRPCARFESNDETPWKAEP